MPTTSIDKAGWLERNGGFGVNGMADDATSAGAVV
jgi:hypothetical protein